MFPYTDKYTESEYDIQLIVQNAPTMPKYIWKITKGSKQCRTSSKVQILFYNIYKFHNSYFVISVYFVYFVHVPFVLNVFSKTSPGGIHSGTFPVALRLPRSAAKIKRDQPNDRQAQTAKRNMPKRIPKQDTCILSFTFPFCLFVCSFVCVCRVLSAPFAL